MLRVARELLEALLLAMIVFLVIQTSVRNFKVEGSSMDPTLEDGQFLLVNKLVYFPLDTHRLSRIVPFWQAERSGHRFAVRPPERGEVIVFRFPGKGPPRDFVKRVIGLPGEKVEVRNGSVFIDGKPLSEDYINGVHTSCDGNTKMYCGPLSLADKTYYVLGDNRGSSNDSRTWGPVPEKNVLGKVWFVYWPFSELSLLDSVSSAARAVLP